MNNEASTIELVASRTLTQSAASAAETEAVPTGGYDVSRWKEGTLLVNVTTCVDSATATEIVMRWGATTSTFYYPHAVCTSVNRFPLAVAAATSFYMPFNVEGKFLQLDVTISAEENTLSSMIYDVQIQMRP